MGFIIVPSFYLNSRCTLARRPMAMWFRRWPRRLSST